MTDVGLPRLHVEVVPEVLLEVPAAVGREAEHTGRVVVDASLLLGGGQRGRVGHLQADEDLVGVHDPPLCHLHRVSQSSILLVDLNRRCHPSSSIKTRLVHDVLQGVGVGALGHLDGVAGLDLLCQDLVLHFESLDVV